MNQKILLLLLSTVLFQACGQNNPSQKKVRSIEERIAVSSTRSSINAAGNTVQTRFTPPKGYQRIPANPGSFSNYLRQLPLKKVGAEVTYFDGTTKTNRNVYDAVVDLPIGKRDLHQCADAIMRLRAEYLFEQKKYDSIHFNFTNGFRADYTNWKNGNRIAVTGNNVRWKSEASPSVSYQSFWKYLEMVFSYAGTASLEKEMQPIQINQIQIGDVFIKGGFPGHAVIVVDMAINQASGEKAFLLAQSYMPAQEIQILKNPNSTDLSPWYAAKVVSELKTPEWIFEKEELKRFK